MLSVQASFYTPTLKRIFMVTDPADRFRGLDPRGRGGRWRRTAAVRFGRPPRAGPDGVGELVEQLGDHVLW